MTPGLATRAWPAWRYDLRLASLYHSRLSRELESCLDPAGVAREWLASELPQISKAVLSALAQQAWSWLTAMGFAQRIEAAISRVLNDLWAEGFAVGQEAGREALDSAYDSAFWDAWHPGDPDAAALTAGPGLQAMLQNYGIQTIRSVSRTRMHELAGVLADGFTRGDPADTIAEAIRPVLRNPGRAQMIATTELARATTLASVGEYRKAGQTAKRWSGTPDQRICPACEANVEAGAIPIGNAFPSGAVFTPGHPLCRCAILPGDLPAGPVPDLGNLTAIQKGLLAEYLDSGLTVADWLGIRKSDDEPLTSDGFVAGGLAVRADDTGRVLMIQRAFDEDDPAGGYWEFPGGRPESEDESVLEAARREWAEETGLVVPPGKVVSTWDAGDYRGHVLAVESESAVPILDREKGANPDDPDNEAPEAVAWWDPAELKNNPAVRPELQDHPKRVRHALEATGVPVNKFSDPIGHNRMVDSIQGLRSASEASGEAVYQQLLRNYPPDSIEWVLRAKWAGPYLVPWDKIDHDDMDKWAASHQPEKIKHFQDKIEANEDVDPAVLIADPDGNYIDIDGHHRALAYHGLGRPVRSWVGVIDPADRHAAEETHLDQVHEGADPLNKAWGDAWQHELRDPHGRWTDSDGNGPASRDDPITFRVRTGKGNYTEHHSIEDARAKVDQWRRSGVRATIGYAPGHDARHVSQLVRRVLSGEISQADALAELSHAPKLQEKLMDHLVAGRVRRRAGGPAPKPPPPPPPPWPRPDPLGRTMLNDLRRFVPVAQPKALKSYADNELSAMLRELAREIYDDHPDDERKAEIRRLTGLITREQDRRVRAARRKESADRKKAEQRALLNADPELIGDLSRQAVTQAEQLLGAPAGSSNYKRTTIIPKQGNENFLAFMGWDGTMKIREDVAVSLLKTHDSNVPMTLPQSDAYEVLLHEAIHSVGQGDWGTSLGTTNMDAYHNRLAADVEEGMTELGAALHAPEFFAGIGVGDRETVFAASLGNPYAVHLTLQNLARRYASSSALADSESWGHYYDKVSRMEKWLMKVATLPSNLDPRLPSERVTDLADEINRSGVAGKLGVMADQLLQGFGLDPDQRVPGTDTRMGSAVLLNLTNYLSLARVNEPGVPSDHLISEETQARDAWDTAFAEVTGMIQAWKDEIDSGRD